MGGIGGSLLAAAPASALYWSVAGGSTIRVGPLSGAGPVDLFSVAEDPRGVALDLARERVLWTNLGDDSIMARGLDGGLPDAIVGPAQGAKQPYGIAVHGDRVYWTNTALGDQSIRYAALDGSGEFGELYGSDDNVIEPDGVAIDPVDERLYWSEHTNDGGRIRSAPLDGSEEPEEVYGPDLLGEVEALTLDPESGTLFWADLDSGGDITIRSAPIDGTGPVEPLFAPFEGNVSGLAVDPVAGRLYWPERGNDVIQTGRADGNGSISTLYGTDDAGINPRGIALGPASLRVELAVRDANGAPDPGQFEATVDGASVGSTPRRLEAGTYELEIAPVGGTDASDYTLETTCTNGESGAGQSVDVAIAAETDVTCAVVATRSGEPNPPPQPQPQPQPQPTPAPQPAPGGDTGGSGGGGAGLTAQAAAVSLASSRVTVSLPSRRSARRRGRAGRVATALPRVRCRVTAPTTRCVGTLVLLRGRGRHAKSIATARFDLKPGTRTITVRLTPAATRQIRKSRSLVGSLRLSINQGRGVAAVRSTHNVRMLVPRK